VDRCVTVGCLVVDHGDAATRRGEKLPELPLVLRPPSSLEEPRSEEARLIPRFLAKASERASSSRSTLTETTFTPAPLRGRPGFRRAVSQAFRCTADRDCPANTGQHRSDPGPLPVAGRGLAREAGCRRPRLCGHRWRSGAAGSGSGWRLRSAFRRRSGGRRSRVRSSGTYFCGWTVMKRVSSGVGQSPVQCRSKAWGVGLRLSRGTSQCLADDVAGLHLCPEDQAGDPGHLPGWPSSVAHGRSRASAMMVG
jgi:hypothetical protein